MLWLAIILGALVALYVAYTFFVNRGPKAPPPEIAEDDKSLVSRQDFDWYSNLSMNAASKFLKQDNIFRLATVLKYQRERGLSTEEAFSEMAKFFPIFYTDPSSRTATGVGDDAKLPFILKDRVNRSPLVIRTARSGEYPQLLTMNAVVRQLIRAGRI